MIRKLLPLAAAIVPGAIILAAGAVAFDMPLQPSDPPKVVVSNAYHYRPCRPAPALPICAPDQVPWICDGNPVVKCVNMRPR